MTTPLKNVVMAVDGVTEVFPARSLWQRLPARAASVLNPRAAEPENDALVDVRDQDGRTEVTVRVGVSSEARTPDVVRGVAAAVRKHFAPADVSVKVTVARIAPAGPVAAGSHDA
ncbi:hypothetical protein DFO47_10577 [Arthrobacter sp. AG258]|uniref:hypothetical protein n=1 Tax=Arthrobacter sp. AG258 TaxID=2183899 RepID=UPI00106127C2|nr:hypothetical protein [Arthrobacter sp. AG258]TDT79281.1 hypothetical protein DFO47_10577 [Arthrobacter sp. AG258]